MYNFQLTIILCYVIFISGLAYSNVIKLNKLLTPLVVPFECESSGGFVSFNATDIGLTFENGYLNLAPLDICGELIDSPTPVEECPRTGLGILFVITPGDGFVAEDIYVSIDNGKNFCLQLSPCYLLSILRNQEFTADKIPTTKISISYTLDGHVKKPANFGASDVKPSFKMSAVGSRLQLDNTSTSNFNATFIGSIAAIRHNSSCDDSKCGLTIGGMKRSESNILQYTKDVNIWPYCSSRSESDTNNLHSTIDYFKVENVDKFPVDTEYEIVSSITNEPLVRNSPTPPSRFTLFPPSTSQSPNSLLTKSPPSTNKPLVPNSPSSTSPLPNPPPSSSPSPNAPVTNSPPSSSSSSLKGCFLAVIAFGLNFLH